MRFMLNIETHNVALTEDGEWELSRLLRKTADAIENGRTSGPLIDYNGATVGTWTYESEGE